jgi:hypothetical protein
MVPCDPFPMLSYNIGASGEPEAGSSKSISTNVLGFIFMNLIWVIVMGELGLRL